MWQIVGVRSLKESEKIKNNYPYTITIPDIYVDVIKNPKRINILYGPRFTGKSYVKAIELLWCAYTLPYFRCIFARNTATATRKQQFQLFKDTIERHKFLIKEFEINKTEMTITCNHNGNYLQGGSFDKGPSLLSIVPDPTRFWADEPISHEGSIKRETFLTLLGNLRGPNNEPINFDFTFNPINKQNFIYKDFFDPETKVYNENEVSITKVLIPDNPFCPQSSLDFLETLKRTNPERYLVDGLGEFGETTNDAPFFYHYENIKFNDLTLIDGEKLDVSFDFNFNPVTIVMGYKIYGVGLFIYDCFSIDGGTENACLKTKHIIDGHVGGVRVTGDFSGNQRSAAAGIIGGQEVTDYLKVQKTWNIGSNSFFNTKTVNPLLHKSRELSNSVLHNIPIYFNDNDNCKELYNEIQKAKSTESNDGKIGLYKNRELGYGMDRVDAFRYLLNLWFPDDERDVIKFRNSLQ